jgi:signal transduction histidine kinase
LDLNQLSFLFFGICSFFISILIWLKRGDYFGQVYFFFSLVTAIWGINFSIMIDPQSSYENSLLASRITLMAALFIPSAWVNVTSVLVKRQREYKKLILFGYIFSIAVFCLGLTKHYVSHVAPFTPYHYYPRAGFLMHFFTAFFLVYVSLGTIILLKGIKAFNHQEQAQMRGFAIATGAGFLGGFFTFLPMYDVYFPQHTLYLLPIYPFLMAYFMIKKNLFSEEDFVLAAHKDKLAFMGTLSSSINHEIRNPLYIAQGVSESFLESLKDGLVSEKEVKDKTIKILQESKSQITRALDIVANFSSFMKADQNVDSKEKMSLKSTIENILSFVSHEASKKKTAIKLEGDLAFDITLNKRQFEQVILNLLLNAIQAFEKPEGKIEITAKQTAAQVILTIQDNGPGMAKKQLDQIFEPFYTTKEEGTGLGLYITKQLVERNGGTIRVESEVGVGTKFILGFQTA